MHFRQSIKYQISSKSVQQEPSCSMWWRTDRQRDITTLTVAFRNFAKAPKIRVDYSKWLVLGSTNKAGNVRITQQWCAFAKSLPGWKSNKDYIFWVCVCVALVILHAKRMRRIVLSFVACPALPYFSTLSQSNGTIFGKKLLSTKCTLIFCTTCVSNISHYKKNACRYYHNCTVPVILVIC
jgi:hypothetical protein